MMDLEELFAMDEFVPEDKGLDLDIVARIKQRRRQLLIHSFLYYRMNESIVSDYKYDEWAQELIQLQKNYPAESKEAPHYQDFKDFEMGSSFILPFEEPWVIDCARRVLEYHRGLKK